MSRSQSHERKIRRERLARGWVTMTIRRVAPYRMLVHYYDEETQALCVDELLKDGSRKRIRTTPAADIRG